MLRQHQKSDSWLALTVVVLTLFGLLMVYDASVVDAYHKFGDKYFYLKKQLQWAGLGALLSLIFSRINYFWLKKFSGLGMLVTVLLLVLVLVPGIGARVMGAQRWINLAGFSLQPAELTKLTLVVYLAAWFSERKPLWPIGVLAGLILGLVMLEPDLGTAVVIMATGFLMYFLAGPDLASLILFSVLGSLTGAALIWLSPYRRQRLLTFLNPAIDPLGASYHIRQILIAIGSGGLFGLGLGKSRQKYEYLPAGTTDSIFAIIAEEIGFIASVGLIFIFLFLIWRGIRIAKQAPDDFGRLLAAGIVAWLGVQTLINLAAMLALVPLTGVPLPFISYGGSSMVMNLLAVGILLNISYHQVARR